jgi:chromosome segregation protein
MYLQSLEMIGFKSFAPRTILNFHRGVTAIVGPNGCGKSNVLDAIRWVLGEQSAKALRGGEMADVIFGGTDSRPALGMAEVSLTFADCEKDLGVEWNEVRITRRVYRDGRSEYFLNKAPCRLRDIHELFMDTGVGRSAYSIMEQGKIDMILSSRPEDRRAIFEEAAGITKYKAQKKEALRKLEYTEANLLRVQDIIKEVRRQIGSLQRQAAKARRYQGLLADLRTLDTHLSRRNYDGMRAELEGVQTEMNGLDEARAVHEQETAEQERELDDFRGRLSTSELEISSLREAVQELRNRIFSAENRIGANAERMAEGRSLIGRHEAEIAAAEEKLGIQRSQIARNEEQIAAMVEVLRERETELSEKEGRLSSARAGRIEAERLAGSLSEETARLETRLASLRSEISAAAGRREASETRLRLLSGEETATKTAATEMAQRLETLAGQRSEVATRLEAAHTAQQEALSSHEAAQKRRQEAEYALNLASKNAASIESRLEVLRQLQEHGEGLAEGTQALLRGLDEPDRFRPALLGALADRIRVSPEFVPAIEAALGPNLQTVVFADDATAKAAMESLARGKAGRGALATPLWVSRPAAPPATLPAEALCFAADRITGEGDVCILATTLLDGIVLANDLEAALRIRASHPTLAIATLAGDFVDRSGVVHTGSAGDAPAQSALARRAQIEALSADLDRAIHELEAGTQTRHQAIEAMEQAQERLIACRDAVQHSQVEAAALANEEALCNRQSADLVARLAAFQRESLQISDSLAATQTQLVGIEAGIEACLTSLEETRCRRSEAEASCLAARERETQASDDLNEVRVAVATSRQQHENLASQRRPMDARVAELTDLADTRRREIASYSSRIAGLEAESDGLRGELERLAAERTAAEARTTGAVAARDDLRSQAESVETALRASRGQIVRIQEQKGALEVRSTQITMRMENLRTHISQRYHLDLESFEADTYALLASIRERTKKPTPRSQSAGSPGDFTDPDAADQTSVAQAGDGDDADIPTSEAADSTEEGVPWDRVEALVADLTERLESMGPVNLDAIQEFEELEQRQLFLEKQNADLVNSKVELLEVISRINRTTRELFADTFVKIRDNFRVMFSELFGGGQANLELMDEADPLECGIEIVARPPGKQLKSVSLLSGGERTMTAVSLLFAIYMVKPSPFCVLDEMDAPLDESNISRFVRILDRFVNQSQFVVITHNKRTISRAEMLYGVTMEEHGVSKLVSVRFSENATQPPPPQEALPKAGVAV